MNMEHAQTQTPLRDKSHGSSRARRASRIFVPIVVVALILFSLMNVYLALRRDTLPEEIEGLVLYENVRDEVVQGPVSYDIYPPPGGPNSGIVQVCGRYRVPIQDENAVASLAVGAVWIAYDPDLPEEEIDALESLAAPEFYALIAPYPDLKAPIVLTAWGAQLEVEASQDLRIAAFLRDYLENENVPNASEDCTEGVSVPAGS